MYCGRICKLCEEDILTTFDDFSCYFHGTADSGLPEWKIEYMVKTKWDQRTFDDTENKSSQITGSGYQTAESVNTLLNNRPYKEHENTYKHINNGADNRHKTASAEKGQRIWKLNGMETIMQCRNSETDNNTAEYTHL